MKLADLEMTQNIQKIWDPGLCVQCGTCAGICPNAAIQMLRTSKGNFFPEVNDRKCKQCNFCIDVCPGHYVNFGRLSSLQIGGKYQDDFVGKFISISIGHATNEKIRRISASGGIVSSLLIFALERGIIDGALVTRMKRNTPLEPEVIVAKTKEEILSAAQSKYIQIPINTALQNVINDKGKFAIVGLPCHIHGVRKAEFLFENLREKLILHIGLFCSSCSFLPTDHLLKKLKIKSEKVDKLEYREGKWPGQVLIGLKDGTERRVGIHDFDWLLRLFTPLRCSFCVDHTNELADISLGDAWLPELKGQKGWSVIISRTDFGEIVLKKAEAEQILETYFGDKQKLIESQKNSLLYKKVTAPVLINIHKALHQKTPIYVGAKHKNAKFFDYVISLLSYLTTRLTSTDFFINISLRVNDLWLKKYTYFLDSLRTFSRRNKTK